MTAIAGWLIGTKAGRYVALGLLAAAAIGIVFARIYAAGKAAEALKQTQAQLKALRSRIKTDDEIARLSPADRRKRLSEWVSDD